MAYLLAFIELEPKSYSFGNLLEPLNNKYEYLDELEISRLHLLRVDGSGVYSREVLTWVIDKIGDKISEGFSDRQALKFKAIVSQLHSSIHTLFRMQNAPILFVYTHFVCVLSALYTPLFALLVADSFPLDANVEALGLLCVLLNCAFVIGLRDICYRLSNPFGLHDEDFQVVKFITTATENSLRTLSPWKKFPVSESTESNEGKDQVIPIKSPEPSTSESVSQSQSQPQSEPQPQLRSLELEPTEANNNGNDNESEALFTGMKQGV